MARNWEELSEEEKQEIRKEFGRKTERNLEKWKKNQDTT